MTICVPFNQKEYMEIVDQARKFRLYIDCMIENFPELFPSEISNGYRMKDSWYSKKLGIKIRRIKTRTKNNYTIRPSFAMPYMTGLVKDVEKVIFLRKFAIPFWALTYSFGQNPMYWYRIEQAIGRNSLVGTTIRNPKNIPEHLCADEKHSWIKGNKVYVATTIGSNCILGASVSENANEDHLREAYDEFKQEARILKPKYSPKTVNMDGWEATRNVWKKMFPRAIIIFCFLHIYIASRDRVKKKYKSIFENIANKLWEAFRKKKRQCFSQSIRRLHEWAEKSESVPLVIVAKLAKLRKNIVSYSIAYRLPGCHRTSNMLERIMQRMDKFLFSLQYFHGKKASANSCIRGWALIFNFAPWNPRTVRKKGFLSLAEQLNQFRYHDCWLQNLFISASLGGYRTPPQNPL